MDYLSDVEQAITKSERPKTFKTHDGKEMKNTAKMMATGLKQRKRIPPCNPDAVLAWKHLFKDLNDYVSVSEWLNTDNRGQYNENQ